MLLLCICQPAATAIAQSSTPATSSPTVAVPPLSGEGRSSPNGSPIRLPEPATAAQSDLPADRSPASPVASQGNQSDRPPPSRNQRPAVVELAPELMYLRDESGKLVPVPGFSYEDFLELMRLKHELAQPAVEAPPYSFQQIILEGETNGRLAHLTARFDVLLTEPDWVQVPLGMGSAALEGPVDYEGGGECLLDYYERESQYRAWLR